MADAAIKALTEGENLRVWSFIVTLFGDLARGPRDRLSGTMLTAMAARVGIKPASMRVALHRLRKDGWIDSQRAGRASLYFLTRHGRAQSLEATKRIYAPVEQAPESWHVLIAPPDQRPVPAAAGKPVIEILPGVLLGTGPAPARRGFLHLQGQIGPVPDWVRAALVSDDLRRDYARFEQKLGRVEKALPEHLTPLDIAVLRGLIVHGWRRLLLRHPQMPDDFLGPQCRISPCRAKVMALLDRLGPAELRALEAALTG